MRKSSLYFSIFSFALCGFVLPGYAAPRDTPSTWSSEIGGNISSDKISAMPEEGQAAMLSKATHYNCLGTDPYYVGTITQGVNKNVALWSITCGVTKKKFMIMIAPDTIGSTKVVSCNLLAKSPFQCYSRFRQ